MTTATGTEEELNVRGLVSLLGVIALIVSVCVALHVGGALIVISAILGMIMLHEFGHFITAKWAGMKVTDFFLGFGPTLWSVKKGETRFGVKALPAGGFVRVIGMNNLDPIDDPAEEHRTYRSKSYWQRLRFAAAGSFMHFVIAFFLLIVLLAGFGRIDYSAPPTTTIDDVAKSLTQDGPASPAAAAGLKVGDKIVAIGTTEIKEWSTAQQIIRRSANVPLQVTVERGGSRRTVTVTPAAAPPDAVVPGVGMVGVAPGSPRETYSLPSAVWNAGFELKNITKESAGSLVGLFSKSSLSKYADQLGKRGEADPNEENNRLLSPAGLGPVAQQASRQGGAAVLSLLISINVFVAIFNLIPLPPFDGGHIAVATYEAIRSKLTGRRYRIDMAKLLPVAYAVVLGLVLMSASALWLDIVHPLNLG